MIMIFPLNVAGWQENRMQLPKKYKRDLLNLRGMLRWETQASLFIHNGATNAYLYVW